MLYGVALLRQGWSLEGSLAAFPKLDEAPHERLGSLQFRLPGLSEWLVEHWPFPRELDDFVQADPWYQLSHRRAPASAFYELKRLLLDAHQRNENTVFVRGSTVARHLGLESKLTLALRALYPKLSLPPREGPHGPTLPEDLADEKTLATQLGLEQPPRKRPWCVHSTPGSIVLRTVQTPGLSALWC